MIRGFVREAFALAGWVAATVLARLFYAHLAAKLTGVVSTPSLRMVLGFALIFIGVLLLSALLGYLLSTLLKSAGLSSWDRFLGAVFGAVRGILAILALITVIMPYARQDAWWQASTLVPAFARYSGLATEMTQGLKQQVW